MEKIFTDTDFLIELAESLETEFYTFGANSDYDGMDVKNIKNPIFSK